MRKGDEKGKGESIRGKQSKATKRNNEVEGEELKDKKKKEETE